MCIFLTAVYLFFKSDNNYCAFQTYLDKKIAAREKQKICRRPSEVAGVHRSRSLGVRSTQLCCQQCRSTVYRYVAVCSTIIFNVGTRCLE